MHYVQTQKADMSWGRMYRAPSLAAAQKRISRELAHIAAMPPAVRAAWQRNGAWVALRIEMPDGTVSAPTFIP